MEPSEQIAPPQGNAALAIVAAAAAWLVPGLGHLLIRKWWKAIAYFVAVALLAVVGLRMRGDVFTFGGDDIFDRLGFFAELGNGVFYFLANRINPAGSDIARAAGDYGTRLFATAGVLNLLCVVEAFHLGWGGEAQKTDPV